MILENALARPEEVQFQTFLGQQLMRTCERTERHSFIGLQIQLHSIRPRGKHAEHNIYTNVNNDYCLHWAHEAAGAMILLLYGIAGVGQGDTYVRTSR